MTEQNPYTRALAIALAEKFEFEIESVIDFVSKVELGYTPPYRYSEYTMDSGSTDINIYAYTLSGEKCVQCVPGVDGTDLGSIVQRAVELLQENAA